MECLEEKQRTLTVVDWLAVALALLVSGLLLAVGALAIYLWAMGGYFGLIGLALATLAAGVGVLYRIHHQIQSGPSPFSETIEQFRKDRACLLDDKSES